jgi:23S rRNA (adenine2503-C2)-methyltransferase
MMKTAKEEEISSLLHVIKEESSQALKLSAFNLSQKQWEEWFLSKNLPSYNGKQVFQWIFQKGCLDPLSFTNISQAIRTELAECFDWKLLDIHSRLFSKDGSEKLLLQTEDRLLLEMVIMPYDDRVTLCISSQVGCRMGCSFCQTGKMGFKRNLTSGEILGQILLANQLLQENPEKRKISNVVFMGMGEPLDNYDEVVKACLIMLDRQGLSLSKDKVTVSTSGLVPEIYRLGRDVPVRLAISLHSADETKRSQMMPINRKYPLTKLKKALLEYPAPSRYGITLEYVMIEGENDSLLDAKRLVTFIHGLKAKVNLIPINHFPGLKMKPSQEEALLTFQKYLSDRSIPAPIRYSRAQDVSGGCGQLAAKEQKDLDKDPRELYREKRASARLTSL